MTEQVFIENQLLHVPYPPYGHDLAPPNFWLFGRIKTGLADRSFAEPDELLEGVREFLEGISAAELTAVFEGWIDRVRWVIEHNEQYYRSSMLYNQFQFPIASPWLCRKNILIRLNFHPQRLFRHSGVSFPCQNVRFSAEHDVPPTARPLYRRQ
jgi:hypothetical protein